MMPHVQLAESALFLDVDGTLVPLAPTPEDVYFDSTLLNLLSSLYEATQQALCLVSGRDQRSLESLCQPLTLPLVGCHGATGHLPMTGKHWAVPINQAQHHCITQRCKEWCQRKAGLRVEPKSHSIAIHYRQCPQAEKLVQGYLAHLALQHPDYALLAGKSVFELRHTAFSKATAIAHLMSQPPFQHKRPIMVGDDRTDEVAFDWVNQHQGISLYIGTQGPTCAHYSLPTPHALIKQLQDWLFFSAGVSPSR